MSAQGGPQHFERVALIGIGLINGSLALNLRAPELAGEIVACARTRGDAREGAGARPRRSRHDRAGAPPSRAPIWS